MVFPWWFFNFSAFFFGGGEEDVNKSGEDLIWEMMSFFSPPLRSQEKTSGLGNKLSPAPDRIRWGFYLSLGNLSVASPMSLVSCLS